MFDDPVEQSFFEPDVVPCFFTLEPLVAKDLFALRQKLLVKERLLHEFGAVIGSGAHGPGNFHNQKAASMPWIGAFHRDGGFDGTPAPEFTSPGDVTV